MSGSLLYRRCFNHAQREAAALCPECKRAFCRECVIEHEGRMVCASCLQRLTRAESSRMARFATVAQAGAALAAFVLVWFLFYALGAALLQLPASFHEGEIWQAPPWAP